MTSTKLIGILIGKPTTYKVGQWYAEKNNGTLFESRTYDQVSGQLKQVSAASAVGNELHYLAYYYGRFGNLDSQTMESNNGAMSVTESYSYDDLHRLTGSSLSSGGSISYSYDATGNLTQKSDYASSMTYGSSGKSNTGNAGPNAVLSATLVGGGSTSFSYDNNGNLISGAGKTISYNALNKPTQITADGSTVNFAYDANWQRFKKTVSGSRTVYYIDDSVEIEQVDDTTITRTYIDDVAIVKRTKYAGLSLASHEITYTLRDRLGSVVTLTDHNNNILEHRSYDPFGKPRYGTMLPSSAATLFDVVGGTPFTRRGFTDHEHIDEAQLIHMNGRVYDYNLGRFLSIDPLIQAPGNSQSLNPYSYIMNNPLAGTDPSGYALVQGSIDCDESMAACVTVLNGGTPTKNDFSGAAASNGSAPSNDGSDSDVEAEELGAPGEVGVSENHTLAITPKSDKIDADLLFEQLNYDPNGRSENANAVLNPLDALEAKEAADEAVELTKEAFPNIRTAWNNVADAFRHATWNYLMTKKLGVDAAKEFGDAHERYSGNALGETTMDLYNNNVDRILGSNPDFKVEEVKRVILRAIRQGDLRTKPFEIIGGAKMSRLITKFVTIILVLILGGCGVTSKVTLKNSSSEQISNVKVYASESLIWQGELVAGQSVSASFNADKDGALRITGNGNSKKFDTGYLGYTTPNDGVFHTITYLGQGVTSYEYVVAN